jgi:hypothetical protein
MWEFRTSSIGGEGLGQVTVELPYNGYFLNRLWKLLALPAAMKDAPFKGVVKVNENGTRTF